MCRYEPSSARHGIVGFIPQSAIIVQDMEEVSLLEREFLGRIGLVGVESSDDLLGRLDGRRRLGECRKGSGSRDVMVVVFVAIQ